MPLRCDELRVWVGGAVPPSCTVPLSSCRSAVAARIEQEVDYWQSADERELELVQLVVVASLAACGSWRVQRFGGVNDWCESGDGREACSQ